MTYLCYVSNLLQKLQVANTSLMNSVSNECMIYFKDKMRRIAISVSLYWTWSIFHCNFNLDFGIPATDVCASCVQHKLKVMDLNASEDDRQVSAAEYILHRRRARMFYTRMNEIVPDTVTICFDVMENLGLPRTPIGAAYYSHQLYTCVCHHHTPRQGLETG